MTELDVTVLCLLSQIQWLLDNYETAEGVSLPRSTLYNHYLRHCAATKIDAVNAASFGKLIRSVFIGLKTRRLGTRYVCHAILLSLRHVLAYAVLDPHFFYESP